MVFLKCFRSFIVVCVLESIFMVKVVIVIGVGLGIGCELVFELIKDVWIVVLVGCIKEKFDEIVELVVSKIVVVIIVVIDVFELDFVDNFFWFVVDEFGWIDFFFNNVGINVLF